MYFHNCSGVGDKTFGSTVTVFFIMIIWGHFQELKFETFELTSYSYPFSTAEFLLSGAHMGPRILGYF